MEKKGISIYRLSKMTNLPDQTIRNYKNGSQLTFTNACKIADALGVSLDELRDKKVGKQNDTFNDKRNDEKV